MKRIASHPGLGYFTVSLLLAGLVGLAFSTPAQAGKKDVAELRFGGISADPKSPVPGKRFKINVTMWNKGKGNAVRFQVDAISGGNSLGKAVFPELKAGGRATRAIALTYPGNPGAAPKRFCVDLLINRLKNVNAEMDKAEVCVSAKTVAKPIQKPEKPSARPPEKTARERSSSREETPRARAALPSPGHPVAPKGPIEIKIASLDISGKKFALELANEDKERDLRSPLVVVEINQAGKKTQIYKDYLPNLPADGTRLIRILVPEDTKPTDSLEIKVNKKLIGQKGLKGLIEAELDPIIPDRPLPGPIPEPIPGRPIPRPVPDLRPLEPGIDIDTPIPDIRPLLCPLPDRVIYVNSATGNDSTHSGGRPECAFKTITRALAVARSGQQIHVAAGVYDAGLGERFPLVLPAGVHLAGVEYPEIRGGGRYPAAGEKLFAVVTTDESSLTGFEVSNQLGVGVLCHGRSVIRGNLLVGSHYAGVSTLPPCTGQIDDNIVGHNTAFGITTWGDSTPTITRNSIARNRVGIDTAGSSTAYIRSNYIIGNTDAGVKVSDRSQPRLRGNVVRSNIRGVWVQSEGADPDLGRESNGENVLSCNLGPDLEAQRRTIGARGNLWDHVPPSPSDIVTQSGGRVDTAGARLASTACPSEEMPAFFTIEYVPDLIVAGFQVEPAETRLGNELRAVARIRNFFSPIDTPVEVGLYAAPVPTLGFGPPWRQTLIAVATIADGFDGDGSATETVEFRIPTPLPGVLSESGHPAGRFTLRVHVDHNNRIEEVNDNNNLSESVQILIMPSP